MISFGPTDEQQVAREAMRDFAEAVLRPAARECDEAEQVPDDLLNTAWELGLTSTQIPEEFGGGGEPRSPITNVLVLEELARGDASLALAATSPSLFAMPIADQGSEEQKREYLPLFSGSSFHAASLAVAEAGAGFDAYHPRTTAEPKGDRFVLSGSKRFVPLADRASHFLVIARRAGEPNGLAAYIVASDAAGLRVTEPEKMLGLRALPMARMELERVEVPASAELGGGAGCDVGRILSASRTALSAAMVGVSQAVTEYAVPYAKERVAFGEAIGKKQAIAFRLADMRIETDAMRWMTWKAASRLERGADATREAHLARRYCEAHAMKIADDGLQVLGGHGYMREHPVEMWYRNARTLGVLEGAASC